MSFPRPYGRYLLDERIAMGGMAEIFRARTRTEGFEKRICIKRILPHYLEAEDFVTMFRDEASLAARLQNGNIVQVFDFGEEEGTLYLAMEYIDGSDLRRLMSIAKKRGERFGIGHAVQIAIEMCRGLHHAHTLTDDGEPLEIVHRDISPHNVLISRAGEVKITDFGIAKAAARATHTGTGVVKGKLSYMAPEQALGQPIDQRVDQFATGIVLWEMLTGERLFGGGEEVSILRKVMQCEVSPPRDLRPEIPDELQSVIMQALAASPAARFADMRAFERALSRFLLNAYDDPAESDVRALVTRLLDDAAPARQTAVLPQPAVPDTGLAGALDEAPDASAVFSSSGPSRLRSASISISVDDASIDTGAPTVMVDASSSNPVAPAPMEGTGATRTIAPGSGPANLVIAPAPAPIEPPRPVAPVGAGAIDALDSGAVETTAARPRSGSGRLLAAGAGVVALGAILGVGFAIAGGQDAPDDQVVVTPLPTGAETAPASDVALAATPPVDEEPEPAPPETAPEKAEPPEAPVEAAAPKEAAALAAPPPAEMDDEEKAKPSRRTSRAPSRRSEARGDTRTRGKGKVFVEMKSGWANAYLGARLLCETPCTVQLPEGTHWLRLEGPEGKEQRYKVAVKTGQLVRAVVPPFK